MDPLDMDGVDLSVLENMDFSGWVPEDVDLSGWGLGDAQPAAPAAQPVPLSDTDSLGSGEEAGILSTRESSMAAAAAAAAAVQSVASDIAGSSSSSSSSSSSTPSNGVDMYRVYFGSNARPWKSKLQRAGNNSKSFNECDAEVHVTVEAGHGTGDLHGEIEVEVRVERRPHGMSDEELVAWRRTHWLTTRKNEQSAWYPKALHSATFQCSPHSSVQTPPNQRVFKLWLNEECNKRVFMLSRHPQTNRCKEYLFVAVLRINGQVCAQASKCFEVTTRDKKRKPRNKKRKPRSGGIVARTVVAMVPELANVARTVLSSEAPHASKRPRVTQPGNSEDGDNDSNSFSPQYASSTFSSSSAAYSTPPPFSGDAHPSPTGSSASSPMPLPPSPRMLPVDADGDAPMHAAYVVEDMRTLQDAAERDAPPAQVADHMNQMLVHATGMYNVLAAEPDASANAQAALSEEDLRQLSGKVFVASTELYRNDPYNPFRGANHDKEEASDATLDRAVVAEFLRAVHKFLTFKPRSQTEGA